MVSPSAMAGACRTESAKCFRSWTRERWHRPRVLPQRWKTWRSSCLYSSVKESVEAIRSSARGLYVKCISCACSKTTGLPETRSASLYREGDRLYIGHGGSYPGYKTQTLIQLDDKIGVIVLT